MIPGLPEYRQERFMRKTLFLLLSAAFIFVSNSITAQKTPDFLPVSQIHRGMQGYGLSVFQGTTIERFSVKIIGILKKTGSGSDLILARLSGGPLAKTGVIAGMSGSPVYINGKLIGAVAYAWGFSKETIAGITPIHEMMQTFTYKKANQPQQFKFLHKGKTKIHGTEVASTTAAFRSVDTPLIISGIKPGVFGLIDKPLRSMGFLPVLGGGAGKVPDAKTADKLLQVPLLVSNSLVGT